MQDNNNQMTPIKLPQSESMHPQQNDEGSNSMQNIINTANNNSLNSTNGISSVQTCNILNAGTSASNNKYQSINASAIYKQLDNQSDTIFCPINDPIFQPTPSPNVFMDYKSSNPYFNSSFNTNNMLASTKKPYNNNLFLTPIKEDDRRKPYINSILKESPYFNGNNICRKLNFDDDFDDFSGNSFMPGAGIFEEKKGVFSNFNMNYLLMPQPQYYPAFYNQQFDFHNTSINNMDFQSLNMNKQFMQPSMHDSPDNKKLTKNNAEDHLLNMRQPDIDASSKKTAKSSTNPQKESIYNTDKNNQIISDSNNEFAQNMHIPGATPSNNIFNQQQSQKLSKQTLNNIQQSNNALQIQQNNSMQLQQNNMMIQQSNNSMIISHQKNATNSTTATSSNAPSIMQGNNSNNNNNNNNNNNSKKQRTCNCKKTKCLKLYCDCFAAGELCGQECNCFGCFNTSNSEKRAGAIVSIMDRQPDAFGPKVQSNTHKKGCNCTRSGCLKKYCECYTLGIHCGEYCKCTQCKNIHDATGAVQLTKQMSSDKRQQFVDELETKSSSKKKLFIAAQQSSNKLQKNSSTTSSNEDDDEEQADKMNGQLLRDEVKNYKNNKSIKFLVNGHHEIEEEDEEEDEIAEQEEDEQEISSSLKMYTTPLKQPTNGHASSLATADTANKQTHSHQDNDSEIKNRIVKLKITDTVSHKKKNTKKQQLDKINLPNIQQELIQQNQQEVAKYLNGNSMEMNMKSNIIPKLTKINSKQ